ncbi:MAG: hypothetical protein Q8P84_00425 [Deltaproteobacteria bacterium]|nr:hypothetical protein [Deltaproteobacteria bacterium]
MLTIVIPTRNRPAFLARLLSCYQQMRCPYLILIGDASDASLRKEHHKSIDATSLYPQRSLECSSSSERFRENLMTFNTTEFSVKRTAVMRKSWQTAYQLQLDNYFGEWLVSSLAAIQGKVKN